MIRDRIGRKLGRHASRWAAATTAAVLLATSACTPANSSANPPSSSSARSTWPGPSIGAAAAREMLAKLILAPENAQAAYDRGQWKHWITHEGNCDTREQVLLDQAQLQAAKKGADCKPVCPSVCWVSPYDGVTVGKADDLDIDHIVPLAEAARSGAHTWDAARRQTFANDELNLVAVTARTNRSKGDQDPGRWKPPSTKSWCPYAGAYVNVKDVYRLTVDQTERATLKAMLDTCP